MAIPAGTKLGPYEIVATIGAGGMGEVHRARDTRLGREVAVKTLPAGLAADAERLKRFELEARAASLLSHPNILTVYDVGTSDGQPYIVSELLDGGNLRERLNRGPIPASKAIEIAAAVADGLAAAHARGIVHRDLKPENVFLTRDGRVKVLDFGIAKLTTSESDQPGAAPTRTILTDVGVAVGTLGYMSPEQVRGEPADARSDVFALGAVLHEMIAGAPAFRHDSRIATVNAVLESDPPELGDDVPVGIRRIVRRSVEKSPDNRFQSARDLAFALTTASDAMATPPAPLRRTAHGARQIDWRLAAVASLLSAAIAATVVSMRQPPAPPTVRAVTQFMLQPESLAPNRRIALSADGRAIVYVAAAAFESGAMLVRTPGARALLHIRQFDQLDSRPLAGTDGAYSPFFSPDGAWIGFAAQGKIKKVPVAGGPVITLADANDMLEGSWGPQGQIVFSTREQGLKILGAEGGIPQSITTPDAGAGEIDHHAPLLLPDGKSILFTIHAGPEVWRLAVRSLETNVQRTIVDDGFDARYLPSGHIVYGRGHSLVMTPFDAGRLEITGPAVPVVENVMTNPESGYGVFATASDGTLAYVPEAPLNGRTLQWVDRTGRAEPLLTPPQAYDYPAISPDGKRLAVEITDRSRQHIFAYEFATDRLSRITLDGAESRPVWSADGSRLAFSQRRHDERHVMWQPGDGTAAPQSIVSSSRSDLWAGTWTPNNDALILVEAPPTSLYDIRRVRTTGAAATLEPFISSAGMDHGPILSPDGLWLAYSSFDNGAHHIYVRPVAGGTIRQVSTDGGAQPRWANGELFYRRRGQIMAVPIQTSPTLTIGKPVALFDDVYVSSMTGPPNYDVTADGKRFIFVKAAAEERAARPIRIVQNWIEDVKRRVPGAR